MILGSAGKRCSGTEWYHYQCVGITSLPKYHWYCKDECRPKRGRKKKVPNLEVYSNSAQPDYKFEYADATAWEGLNLLIQKDAVPENGRPQIVNHWKLDFAHFFLTTIQSM